MLFCVLQMLDLPFQIILSLAMHLTTTNTSETLVYVTYCLPTFLMHYSYVFAALCKCF